MAVTKKKAATKKSPVKKAKIGRKELPDSEKIKKYSVYFKEADYEKMLEKSEKKGGGTYHNLTNAIKAKVLGYPNME